MANLQVAVELLGKDSGVASVVGNAVKSLGGMPGAVEAATGALGGLLNTGSKLGLLTVGIGGLMGAVKGLASGFVSGNQEMETYETQLGTLLGSADKAKASLATLAKFGATTPFELPEVVRAEKVLLGFGLTGEKVLKLTGKNADQFRSVVGDVAAGTGVAFEDIALTFGKFSAGATGEAISRFQELGVATREQMAAMGVQFSKSGELLSPLPVAMEAITKIAQSKFGGGMEKLSKTAGGQISTLMDNWNQMKIQLAAPVFDVFKNALANVNDLIGTQGFQAILSQLAELLAGAVQQGLQIATALFERLSAAAQQVGPFLLETGARLQTFFSSLAQGQTLAATVNAAFGDLIPPELNPILDAVDAAFLKVKDTVGGLITTVQTGGLAALWEQVKSAMSDFAPTGERIGSVLSSIAGAIGDLIPSPIKEFVAGLFDTAKGATEGEGVLRTLSGVINTVSQALEDAARFVEDNVAAQTALVAILGAAATAWGLSQVVGAYHAAVGIATTAVNAMKAAQIALNLALTANPIGLVIAVLAGLVIAFKYAYDNSEDFRKIVDDTWETVKVGAKIIEDISNSIRTTLTAAFIAAIKLYQDFDKTVTSTLNSVRNTVNSIFNAISGTVDTVNNAIRTTINSVWNAIPGDIQKDLEKIATEINRRWDEYTDTISNAVEAAEEVISSTWDSITSFISDTLDSIFGNVESSFNNQNTKISEVTGAIVKVVTEAWNTVSEAIGEKLAAALAKVMEFGASAISYVGGLADSLGAAASAAGAEIVRGLERGMAGLWGWMMDRAGDMARGIISSMKSALGIASPSKEAAYLGEEIVNGLIQGIRAQSSGAERTMQEVSRSLIRIGEETLRALKEASQRAANDLGQFNPDMAQKMQRNIDGATDAFISGLTKLGREAGYKLDQLNDRLAADLKRAADDASKAVLEIISASEKQIADLMAGEYLDKQIKARRDAFAESQKTAYDSFKETADLKELEYRQTVAIEEAKLDAQKATDKASTQAERDAIEARRKEQVDAALDRYNAEVAEYNRRKELRAAEDKFRKEQEVQRQIFEDGLRKEELDRTIARIEAERDARIKAVNDALAQKQAAMIADAETERQLILATLKQRVEDLKTEYVDRVKEAMKEAGVNIADFTDKTLRSIRSMADSSIAAMQAMIDKAAEVGKISVTPAGTPGGNSAPGVNAPTPTTRVTPPGTVAPGPGSIPYLGPGGLGSFDPRTNVFPKQQTFNLNVNNSYPLNEAELVKQQTRMALLAG